MRIFSVNTADFGYMDSVMDIIQLLGFYLVYVIVFHQLFLKDCWWWYHVVEHFVIR